MCSLIGQSVSISAQNVASLSMRVTGATKNLAWVAPIVNFAIKGHRILEVRRALNPKGVGQYDLPLPMAMYLPNLFKEKI